MTISKRISIIVVVVTSFTASILLGTLMVKSKSHTMNTTRNNVKDVNNLIVNSLVFSMAEGVSDFEPYMDRVRENPALSEIRIIPSAILDADAEKTMDQNELNVLRSLKSQFYSEEHNGENVFRSLSVIQADESCVDCHESNIGDALAVVSIRYSIEESLEAISDLWLLVISMGLLATFLTFISIKLLIDKQVTRHIIAIIKHIKRLATGDTNEEIILKQNCEIGQAGAALIMLQKNLSHMAEVATHIADGDFSIEVSALSSQDVLGNAMINMRDTLETGQNKIEAALNDAHQKVAYLDNLTFPVHVVDKDMSIVYMNPAGATISGVAAESCIGKKCFDLLPNPHCNTDKCATAKAMRENNTFTSETVITKNGKNMPIQYIGAPVKDANGNIIGAMEQAVDITDVKNVVNEVNHISELLNEGVLDKRAEVAGAKGDYKKLIDGFNSAIDNIMEPVDEAQGCLKKMGLGDLTVKMKGDYKGDHAKMKEAMNNTIFALNDLLRQVSSASEYVSSGAIQVSDSSQSISQGSTEAASSLEETTASITEISHQSRKNAENSTEANGLAITSRNSAETGSKRMDKMVSAMSDINNSSNEISKIIKVIDEIAFQTNLLALNAAVEAARAGEHGKGFAVVAEEVRNLAQRSAKAAKETTELIEGSISKVQNGTKIASQTAEALSEIIDGITTVSSLIEEIATASTEQVAAIDQTSSALGQIDQVTQSQSAASEEGAATAEELSAQAVQLKQLLSRFQLNKTNNRKIDSLLQSAGIET